MVVMVMAVVVGLQMKMMKVAMVVVVEMLCVFCLKAMGDYKS